MESRYVSVAVTKPALRISALLFGVLLGASAWAEGLSEAFLAETRELSAKGDYAGVIDRLEGIPNLVTAAPFMDEPGARLRARIFWDLGRCYFAVGDSARAELMLHYAVDLNPDVTAGILELTDDRAEEGTHAYLEGRRADRLNAVLAATSPWKAAGMSLVLPGLGQRYRGHKRKGAVLMGVATVTVTAFALSVRSYLQARNAYRATGMAELELSELHPVGEAPRPFETRYTTAKSRARRADVMLGAVAAVWAFGVVDNFVFGPGRVSVQIRLK